MRRYPHIKIWLKKAHFKESPERFVKKILIISAYSSIGLSILLFFMFDKAGVNLLYLLPIFMVTFLASFWFFLHTPLVTIRKRQREIDKEVLFAGRYLLVKLQSGTPLFNALIDASKSYGVCSKYFKEIVDDINMGTPIEVAIERAREYNCSEKFKLILTEILTTLKTGADISFSLDNVLKQIAQEQIIEIKEYAKKLNAYVLIYLIIAVVLPSLGMTFFIVIAGFISLRITPTFIFLAIIAIAFINYMFLSLFKSIRPMVNL